MTGWPTDDVERAGPLAGIRILDLSRILAGPFATQILADLGADVIKVERPDGDETRRWGPPFAPSGDAAYFYICNRGRRSLVVDIKQDVETVLALVADADVLVENFLPGAMERLGLSDAVLAERNPRLVHGVISGYGHDSARASWPALDFVIQAHAGIMGVTGPEPGHGLKAGVPIADLTAGLYATIGVLAAVREAERTGTGGRVEVSLAEACMSLLTNSAMNHLVGGAEPAPAGNVHPNVAPYQVVQARDAGFAVAATTERQFERLCAVVGAPELAADPRFASNRDRVEHRAALIAALEERLAARDAGDWVAALNAQGVPSAVVNGVADVFADPDVRRGLVGELDGVPQLRTPIRLGGAPLPFSSAPPPLGNLRR